MISLLKRLVKYANEYILRVKWIKIAITPTLLALMLANYLEVETIGEISKFIDGKYKEHMIRDFLLLIFAYTTLKYLVSLFDTYFIAFSVRKSYVNFLKEYFQIKYYDFQKFGVGEAQYNIQRRSVALYSFFAALTLTFLSNFFFFIIATFKVLSKLTLAASIKVVFVVLLFLGATIYSQSIRSKIRKDANNGFESNSKKLYDILLNYERIKAYDNGEIESQKYYKSMEGQHKYAVIFWCTYDFVRYLNGVLYALVGGFILYEYNKVSGSISDGIKIVFLVGELSNKIKQMSFDIDYICTHFTNLDQSLISKCVLEEKSGTLEISDFNKKIKIRNLRFSFNTKLILKSVNTDISIGEKIAITGVNGGGKSTFVKILMGLYDYQGGSIEMDGYEYSNISRRSLRGTVAYVPQTSQLFDTSIISNLKMGNSTISDEKIVELCKLYNYHTLFNKLGYNNSVGERGRNLSGGQKQKISFMRAILKNSPMIILDEATSNLDSKSEQEIIENIVQNMAGKTVVMIVHNLDTLKYFDKVLFFADHTLKEQGKFEDLYNQKKSFYRFYNSSIRNVE